MNLLLTKDAETRDLIALNENTHAIYIGDASDGLASPWVRWARLHERCHSLTLLEKFTSKMTPLSYTTWERDKRVLEKELNYIDNLLRQNVIVILPMDNYLEALGVVRSTSPEVHALVTKRVDSWRKS